MKHAEGRMRPHKVKGDIVIHFQPSASRGRSERGIWPLALVGGLALVVGAAYAQMPGIRRYVRMTRM